MLQDYLPLRPLGHGATGIVFLASPINDLTTDALFAIKAFRRSRDHDLHRANNEEHILSKLLHASIRKSLPFLPRLHSAFDHGEFRFLVLDFCSGGDLNALRQSQPEKRFSADAIRFYAAEIVLALEHLHEEGIVYRDLKPENILLTSDGHIMLTDFDLSVTLPPKKPSTMNAHLSGNVQESQEDKDHSDDDRDNSTMACIGGCTGRKQQRTNKHKRAPINRSRRRVVPASASILKEDQSAKSSSSDEARSKSFVGTEEYIAPEVIEGTGHDFAVDWWGLGVLLYEMAHACTPFTGRTAKQTFHNILHQEPGLSSSGPLADLILQLLVKDPARRLGSRAGAVEIKAHRFFAGLQWSTLQDVSRPPFIPLFEQRPSSAEARFDLTEHLVQVECARSEARARRRLQRKQAA
ncbi:hypothetical protein L7F22_033608 [Adiantum nelumboides]|nr:hypothetical protein [Adiantum nelumboides]